MYLRRLSTSIHTHTYTHQPTSEKVNKIIYKFKAENEFFLGQQNFKLNRKLKRQHLRNKSGPCAISVGSLRRFQSCLHLQAAKPGLHKQKKQISFHLIDFIKFNLNEKKKLRKRENMKTKITCKHNHQLQKQN